MVCRDRSIRRSSIADKIEIDQEVPNLIAYKHAAEKAYGPYRRVHSKMVHMAWSIYGWF